MQENKTNTATDKQLCTHLRQYDTSWKVVGLIRVDMDFSVELILRAEL
jgi:hypothetical protein